MQRREFLGTVGTVVAATAARVTSSETSETQTAAEVCRCDTFVYGSTPGGIAAAIEAARRREGVVLACPKKNPGGMAASGLCTTDAVRRHLFGGLVLEFIRGVHHRYQEILGNDPAQWKLAQDGWHYEPSVAEHVFRRMLVGQRQFCSLTLRVGRSSLTTPDSESQATDSVRHWRRASLSALKEMTYTPMRLLSGAVQLAAEEEYLEWLPGLWLTDAVVVAGSRIAKVELEDDSGARYEVTARTYIDGTYEGDLAAKADVPYRVGREVPLSSTHVAMSVLRMEPVWMTTGQIAGLAAAEAHKRSCQVAQLDATSLPKTLGIRTVI